MITHTSIGALLVTIVQDERVTTGVLKSKAILQAKEHNLQLSIAIIIME